MELVAKGGNSLGNWCDHSVNFRCVHRPKVSSQHPGLTPWGKGRLVAGPQRGPEGPQARWARGGRSPSGAGSLEDLLRASQAPRQPGPSWGLSPGQRGPQEKGGGVWSRLLTSSLAPARPPSTRAREEDVGGSRLQHE